MESVVSGFEGILLRDAKTFSYFMLVAFEASGLIRFAILLMLWPIICLLNLFEMKEYGLKLMIFIATAGLRVSEIESVARAVLPKFFMDDIDMNAWDVFSSYNKRMVVTAMPRIMVEMFVKEHLRADAVVGCELVASRSGRATGLVKGSSSLVLERLGVLFGDDKPSMGLDRVDSNSNFLPFCKEQSHPPFANRQKAQSHHKLLRPLPVIFHDGRLVMRPTPSTALTILLWIPIGSCLAIIRIFAAILSPMCAVPYFVILLGGAIIVKGKPPPRSDTGVLFVCTHRTLLDPVVLSVVLQRRVPAVTYSLSRLSEFLSPIPTVRLTRIRDVDAKKIKMELSKGDLVVCPEGTTCREPFLLRFSGLFAELTNRIVPVAMNYRVSFFYATTARGWKCLDPVFFLMNPMPVYEVTFLNQLPLEATCSAGKSPHEVANYVQRILAATLDFECTNLTRKDKYMILAGNDGNVCSGTKTSWIKKLMNVFRKVIDASERLIY